jgi:cell division cycle 2-like
VIKTATDAEELPESMSGKRSRWDEDEEEDVGIARQKAEKEAKKKAKLAKKRQESAIQENLPSATAAATITPAAAPPSTSVTPVRPASPEIVSSRGYTPSKRRRISPPEPAPRIFPLEPPAIVGCRSVDIYEKLNHIEEGSYGIVYRAKDTETGDIVALKKLKLEREKNGFPITSLREISTLMAARHPNIVNIREIVMGDSLSQYCSLLPILMVGCIL